MKVNNPFHYFSEKPFNFILELEEDDWGSLEFGAGSYWVCRLMNIEGGFLYLFSFSLSFSFGLLFSEDKFAKPVNYGGG